MIKKITLAIFLLNGFHQSLLADGYGCMGRFSPTQDRSALEGKKAILQVFLRRIINEKDLDFIKDADLKNSFDFEA